MDRTEILKSWKKKTITAMELSLLFRASSDEALSALVQTLVRDGLLAPVKASGTTGNRSFPVYLKYRILLQEDYSSALEEISLLHPRLLQSGYLSAHPQDYLKHKNALVKLNEYLFRDHAPIPVSRKERSFAIFGEEKQLEDKALCRLLSQLGLTGAELFWYDTPEYCFNDYIPQRQGEMTLLICENKDIWFNIRRRMYEDGCREILGTPIDGVVYGCGNKISEYGALEAYTRFLGCQRVQYLYWGDIDREGFEIYLRASKNNPGIHLTLFRAAYCRMVTLSVGWYLPDSTDHRAHTAADPDVLQVFPTEIRETIGRLLEDNKRLPQEIINYETLLKDMR